MGVTLPQRRVHIFYIHRHALIISARSIHLNCAPGLSPAPFFGLSTYSAVRSAHLASAPLSSQLKLTVDLVLQIKQRFPKLGVLLILLSIFVFTQTNGLYESDIILPEDPGAMLSDGYDLKVSNSVRWDPEDTALSQIPEEDAVDISSDSSSDSSGGYLQVGEQNEVEPFEASTQLADLLVQKCTTADFKQFNWTTMFCDSLSEPTEQALQSVLAPLGGAGITSVSLDGITFNFSSVSIGDVNFG